MKSKLKTLVGLVVIIMICFGIGWYSGLKYEFFKRNESQNIDAVLQSVQKVLKLATVEGQTSEIYDYKEYYGYDISLFRKKILIRVNAKVLVGYDLEKANITINETTKSIVIEEFPPPEILSVDHNLDYYDMQQGTFNRFTEEELSKLNQAAKDYASDKALTEELILTAEKQKDENIELLQSLLEAAGWTLTFQSQTIKG